MLSRMLLSASLVRGTKLKQTFQVGRAFLANFATFYEKNKQMDYYERVYKPTSLKFENQGLKMLVYQFSPFLNELASLTTPRIRRIVSNNVIVMSFLADAGEGVPVWLVDGER